MSEPDDSERRALLTFLDAQRAVVLEIIDGLDDDALNASVVPSGWTPLGLVEHLGWAEFYWFQRVATGSAEVDLPWPPDPPDPDEDENAPFTTNHPADLVIRFYREQCGRGNAVLATTPWSSPPRGRPPADIADQVTDLRWIVLHMIEETARHAGHLDIARELSDGRTGLGPR